VNEDLANIDERLTILQAQQGDREALSRLINSYDDRLLYFIRRLGGDVEEALDILQTVWLIVHRKLRRLNSPDAFRVWLYRITHDQTVSYLRKRSKGPMLVEHLEAVSETHSASFFETTFDNAELVHVAMQALSVDHRRVLTLRFLEEMSIEDIAEVINCRPGTVKSRLYYAKEALRKRIEE
jgi:RNA polymerase sigma-70 factor, ECF subfamily